MKLILLTLALSALSIFADSPAFAKCYELDPIEYRDCPATKGIPTNLATLRAEMFGKLYCEINGAGNNGISIHVDGTASYFGPALGAPNPYTSFHVFAGQSYPYEDQAPFSILEFTKGDNTPTGHDQQYVLNRKLGIISSGEYQFSSKACRN